jgi:hypothetical protein
MEKFFDGRGNIGELETYSDGVCVARLMRPGISRSTVVFSKDQRVTMLRNDGREPDLLYDRFEGKREDVVAWLTEKGFEYKPSAAVTLTPEAADAYMQPVRYADDRIRG